jgi:hypothetical protein
MLIKPPSHHPDHSVHFGAVRRIAIRVNPKVYKYKGQIIIQIAVVLMPIRFTHPQSLKPQSLMISDARTQWTSNRIESCIALV